ncbi:hypothetical protein BDN71DRAFT_911953 [Pleurotus eryngii]|uniref:Uncharacterized protein n=1 Tax=Pleurotus eryngii TaxID=5323 RepID=A0A9P5ZWM5_PLEER|nr:hypothetical protein BDN71DRAFT_911953 [Pleurotus eryngii]
MHLPLWPDCWPLGTPAYFRAPQRSTDTAKGICLQTATVRWLDNVPPTPTPVQSSTFPLHRVRLDISGHSPRRQDKELPSNKCRSKQDIEMEEDVWKKYHFPTRPSNRLRGSETLLGFLYLPLSTHHVYGALIQTRYLPQSRTLCVRRGSTKWPRLPISFVALRFIRLHRIQIQRIKHTRLPVPLTRIWPPNVSRLLSDHSMPRYMTT